MLRIYLYGYLNQVQSSRQLERECARNLELIWLTGRLKPDFKTIADFRKDNGPAIREVCRQFVALCRDLHLLDCESIAIDGSKFKAVNAKSHGRFDRADFIYDTDGDVYICPAGQRLTYRFTNEEAGKTLRSYWTTACDCCPIKVRCTTGHQHRIKRWEHEAVLERVQARLDQDPSRMKLRAATVEHPFGTLKAWMGATHFKMRTLKHVATEMALHVLAYNMKRVMAIIGVTGLIQAMKA